LLFFDRVNMENDADLAAYIPMRVLVFKGKNGFVFSFFFIGFALLRSSTESIALSWPRESRKRKYGS